KDKKVATRRLQHMSLLIHKECIICTVTRSLFESTDGRHIVRGLCLRQSTLQTCRNQLRSSDKTLHITLAQRGNQYCQHGFASRHNPILSLASGDEKTNRSMLIGIALNYLLNNVRNK